MNSQSQSSLPASSFYSSSYHPESLNSNHDSINSNVAFLQVPQQRGITDLSHSVSSHSVSSSSASLTSSRSTRHTSKKSYATTASSSSYHAPDYRELSSSEEDSSSASHYSDEVLGDLELPPPPPFQDDVYEYGRIQGFSNDPLSKQIHFVQPDPYPVVQHSSVYAFDLPIPPAHLVEEFARSPTPSVKSVFYQYKQRTASDQLPVSKYQPTISTLSKSARKHVDVESQPTLSVATGSSMAMGSSVASYPMSYSSKRDPRLDFDDSQHIFSIPGSATHSLATADTVSTGTYSTRRGRKSKSKSHRGKQKKRKKQDYLPNEEDRPFADFVQTLDPQEDSYAAYLGVVDHQVHLTPQSIVDSIPQFVNLDFPLYPDKALPGGDSEIIPAHQEVTSYSASFASPAKDARIIDWTEWNLNKYDVKSPGVSGVMSWDSCPSDLLNPELLKIRTERRIQALKKWQVDAASDSDQDQKDDGLSPLIRIPYAVYQEYEERKIFGHAHEESQFPSKETHSDTSILYAKTKGKCSNWHRPKGTFYDFNKIRTGEPHTLWDCVQNIDEPVYRPTMAQRRKIIQNSFQGFQLYEDDFDQRYFHPPDESSSTSLPLPVDNGLPPLLPVPPEIMKRYIEEKSKAISKKMDQESNIKFKGDPNRISEEIDVYVGNVPSNSTRDDIYYAFTHCGIITKVMVRALENYAILTFSTVQEACKAVLSKPMLENNCSRKVFFGTKTLGKVINSKYYQQMIKDVAASRKGKHKKNIPSTVNTPGQPGGGDISRQPDLVTNEQLPGDKR